jgi:UDP-glucose 4-epimerase
MGKIIVVTGGAGHVGSHLIELLVKDENNKVISIDNYFNGTQDNHIKGAKYIKGHTKDIDKLVQVTPDVVYHLGEYARIAPSFDDIEKVFEMNIIGTFEVLEFCRKRNVAKFVYAASSTRFAIEGNGRNQNPYSFTKATNVDLVKNYGEWYGLNYAICYFYNAFGPRERGTTKYATLIAKFQEQFISNKPLTIVKPGTQRRNFTYVSDIARGILLVAEKGSGDGYSLNNNKNYSIQEIAEAFGHRTEYVDGYPGRADIGDIPTKARSELGWDTTVEVIDYIASFVKNSGKKY